MRIIGKKETREVTVDGVPLDPKYSQSIINHSPDGFNWGYGGSGPSQLALALMLLVTDKNTAVKHYHMFKWEYVSDWQGDFDLNLDLECYVENLKRTG